jgi:pimeloyl-ACP methyl ester carboxylesterase
MKHTILGALLVAASLISRASTGPNHTTTTINHKSTGLTLSTKHPTVKSKTIAVDDANLVYRIYGNRPGTPLVLLSPLGSTLDDWDPAIIDGLTRYSTVIAFDNKGVGSSSGKTPATIAAMAHDAASFVKALGYRKVDLLGFSMGGFIAQEIIETEPQLVNKLILVGTGPQGSEGLADIGNQLSSAGSLSPKELFLAGFFAPSETSRQAGERSFARIQAKKEGRDLPISKESFGAEFAAVLGWAQPDPTGFQRARSVTNPVLIFGGQYDFFIPVVNPVRLYQTLPNARLILLPDAGHASFFQYPELFVQEAGNFLRN